MQNNTKNQVYAGFFVRFAAYLIDWVIVGLALLAIRIPVWIASVGGTADFVLKDFIFQYSIYDIVIYVLKVAYFSLLTYFTGSTLGKKLMQIKVVSSEDRKPTFFEIVFRESVGKFLSALVLDAGFIMVGVDKKKRGLHDLLSDTNVIYYHQKKVAVPTPVVYQKVAYAPSPTVQNGFYQQPNQIVPNMGQQPFVPNQPVQQNGQLNVSNELVQHDSQPFVQNEPVDVKNQDFLNSDKKQEANEDKNE